MARGPGGAGWVPDFGSRMLSEDVPCGLVPIRGVAQILGVPTPWTDRVIHWAQAKLGKEYLVGGRLEGRDVAETDAPQAYGVTTSAQLFISLDAAGAQPADAPPRPRRQASSCAAELQAGRLHSQWAQTMPLHTF